MHHTTPHIALLRDFPVPVNSEHKIIRGMIKFCTFAFYRTPLSTESMFIRDLFFSGIKNKSKRHNPCPPGRMCWCFFFLLLLQKANVAWSWMAYKRTVPAWIKPYCIICVFVCVCVCLLTAMGVRARDGEFSQSHSSKQNRSKSRLSEEAYGTSRVLIFSILPTRTMPCSLDELSLRK